MRLFLPKSFDSNEWFITFGSILVITVSLLLPKRFPPLIITTIILFNIFLGQTADYILATPPYDLYDINDRSDYEIFDFILYAFQYTPTLYIAIYLYNELKRHGKLANKKRIFIFIASCALFTTGLERVAYAFHVFTYKGWRLIYSFPVYLIVYALNLIVLNAVQKYVLRNRLG